MMALDALKPAGRDERNMLRRRLGLLAMENVSKRNNAAVRRVIDLLSEENLTDVAAKSRGAEKLVLECGVLDKAWDDTRVANRINQLARLRIKVERELVVTRYGEREFVRERLVITF